MRIAVILSLLTALLWTGVLGCAALTQPPNPALEQRLRAYQAIRSTGN
jgi:hypothetical protein